MTKIAFPVSGVDNSRCYFLINASMKIYMDIITFLDLNLFNTLRDKLKDCKKRICYRNDFLERCLKYILCIFAKDSHFLERRPPLSHAVGSIMKW